MSNSNVPAYILEAKQKGETHVKVLRRVSYSSDRDEFQEFIIPTREAIRIFSTPSQKRRMNERRIKPLGYSTNGPVAPVLDASALGTDAILAELAKRGVQIPAVIAEPEATQVAEPQAAAPRRGRQPVQPAADSVENTYLPGGGLLNTTSETTNPEPTA